jgi:hypothetical protein
MEWITIKETPEHRGIGGRRAQILHDKDLDEIGAYRFDKFLEIARGL